MNQFAAAAWERAHRTLASAQMLVATDPDSAASRAYYAAFHALTALFAVRGQSFTKHTAIRSALHRELVRPGLLSADEGRDYNFLMESRETGDYGGPTHVPRDDAATAVHKAEAFLFAVRRACPELAD